MNETLGTFFTWLIRASWQAGVLGAVVIFVQWLFQERLNAQWRYTLWSLLLLKLLLPLSPQSSISLFNLGRFDRSATKTETTVRAVPTTTALNVPKIPFETVREESRFDAARESNVITDHSPFSTTTQTLSPKMPVEKIEITTRGTPKTGGIRLPGACLPVLGALVWALGVALLALRMTRQNLTFLRRLRVAKTITDLNITEVFQNCKSVLGIQFTVELLETDQVKSPALHGFFKPRLLLPQQLIEEFNQEELRYIFLHELSHVKRRDMAVHWLATALRILHWFNPVLWLSFRRMAADRELACDEMALSRVGEKEAKGYGRAIIRVLERCTQTPGFPLVMGILENNGQMTRRIATILNFKQRSHPSALALVLLILLGLFTLTDAKTQNEAEPAMKAAEINWQKWSPAAVAKARANGIPVIVDFTASWCLTCQVNRKTSLEIDSVRAKIKEIGAIAFVADYTKEVPEITRELTRYKRVGVPLVLIYPADAQAEAIVLPSMLKPNLVLDVLTRAAKAGIADVPNANNSSKAEMADDSLQNASANASIQQLKQDIAVQDANLQALRERNTQNHPSVLQAAQLLATLRKNLKDAQATESRSVPKKSESEGNTEFSVQRKQTENEPNRTTIGLSGAKNPGASNTLPLEEYGRIRGILYRDGSPGKGEDLDLAFANEGSMGIRISNHVITDDQGRFEFDQVPAGELQITSRRPNPGHIRSWSNELLKKVSVHTGQTTEIKINTAPRAPTEDYEKGLRTGQAAILPGVLHGQVLSPNNKPCSAAQVALRADHRYLLSLGQGTLIGKNMSDGLIVLTDENGNFTLPTCELSEAIIAVSDEGIGAVSLSDFKKSPKIRLQPWSRIEGTLKVGARLGTNEIVALAATPFENDLLPLDTRDLDVQTDSQGHFEMKFVPPGKRRLSRVIVLNGGTRADQPLADVIIEPGETKRLNLGGVGQTIIGKIRFKNAETHVDWETFRVSLSTKPADVPQRNIVKRSLEEEIAYQRTEEYNATMRIALKDYRWYPLRIADDGSFVCHDVLPGKYQFYADDTNPSELITNGRPTFYWSGEASVPEVKDKAKADQINLGTVELTFTRVTAR